ncbi:MAG: hypothetical protein IPJ89_05325 [Candidatus Iainarchaeum archaeon]|uniref:Uncharacterized protein n=1 Tax=Candidatus Iainarchaeum sp. TaxID=3101447 RepID=A0A7T9DJL9_9ARCH|nr:MAG: hypothetical protein IPJ89_05325 [Candidatus Diapherotrites archaeon]
MQTQHAVVILIVLLAMSFIIGNAFGQAGAFSASAPNHPLQQIQTTPTSGASVDADGDGIVDVTQRVVVSVNTSTFAGNGQASCGAGTAISGGCDCQGKNITQNTPELNGNQPKGWLCACDGGSDGEVNVVCTD